MSSPDRGNAELKERDITEEIKESASRVARGITRLLDRSGISYPPPLGAPEHRRYSRAVSVPIGGVQWTFQDSYSVLKGKHSPLSSTVHRQWENGDDLFSLAEKFARYSNSYGDSGSSEAIDGRTLGQALGKTSDVPDAEDGVAGPSAEEKPSKMFPEHLLILLQELEMEIAALSDTEYPTLRLRIDLMLKEIQARLRRWLS